MDQERVLSIKGKRGKMRKRREELDMKPPQVPLGSQTLLAVAAAGNAPG